MCGGRCEGNMVREDAMKLEQDSLSSVQCMTLPS